MNNLKGYEKSFCVSWAAWDEVDTGSLQFYNAVLTDDFAKVVGISEASSLFIDGQNSVIAVYDDNGDEVYSNKFKLVLDTE